MPIGFSKQDLELLGYTDIKEMDGSSVQARPRPWQLYKASAVAGVRSVTVPTRRIPGISDLPLQALQGLQSRYVTPLISFRERLR